MPQLLRATDNRNAPLVEPDKGTLALSYFNLLWLRAQVLDGTRILQEVTEETEKNLKFSVLHSVISVASCKKYWRDCSN